MKKILAVLLTVAFVAGLAGIALAEDTYDAVKKKGVLVVGVKDASPGFGTSTPRRARSWAMTATSQPTSPRRWA